MEPWKMKRKKDFAATIIAPGLRSFIGCEAMISP